MKKAFLSLVILGIVSPALTQNIGSRLDTLVKAYEKAAEFGGAVLVATKDGVICSKEGLFLSKGR